MIAIRTLRLARLFAALATVLGIAGLWLLMPSSLPLRRRWEAAGWTMLLAGFGVRVTVRGRPASGALLAANHISWMDIVLLARLAKGSFVAKAEIAGWPVIGPLARRHGAIFVERGRRGTIGTQLASLDRALEGGAAVIVFPEGTTGPGTHLLPFRSSLLAGAAQSSRPVQPVAIRYCRRDGQPLSAAMLRKVAWLGNDALLPHALTLAAAGGLAVEVSFSEPLFGSCRKALAVELRAAIAASLSPGASDDQPDRGASLKTLRLPR